MFGRFEGTLGGDFWRIFGGTLVGSWYMFAGCLGGVEMMLKCYFFLDRFCFFCGRPIPRIRQAELPLMHFKNRLGNFARIIILGLFRVYSGSG